MAATAERFLSPIIPISVQMSHSSESSSLPSSSSTGVPKTYSSTAASSSSSINQKNKITTNNENIQTTSSSPPPSSPSPSLSPSSSPMPSSPSPSSSPFMSSSSSPPPPNNILSVDEMEVCDVIKDLHQRPKLSITDFAIYDILNPLLFPLSTHSSASPFSPSSSHYSSRDVDHQNQENNGSGDGGSDVEIVHANSSHPPNKSSIQVHHSPFNSPTTYSINDVHIHSLHSKSSNSNRSNYSPSASSSSSSSSSTSTSPFMPSSSSSFLPQNAIYYSLFSTNSENAALYYNNQNTRGALNSKNNYPLPSHQQQHYPLYYPLNAATSSLLSSSVHQLYKNSNSKNNHNLYTNFPKNHVNTTKSKHPNKNNGHLKTAPANQLASPVSSSATSHSRNHVTPNQHQKNIVTTLPFKSSPEKKRKLSSSTNEMTNKIKKRKVKENGKKDDVDHQNEDNDELLLDDDGDDEDEDDDEDDNDEETDDDEDEDDEIGSSSSSLASLSTMRRGKYGSPHIQNSSNHNPNKVLFFANEIKNELTADDDDDDDDDDKEEEDKKEETTDTTTTTKKKKTTTTTTTKKKTKTEKYEVRYELKMYKRLNGNQPWVESTVSPPMIGKMRKVTIEFSSIPRPIQLNIYIKQITSKGNLSSLVISESNRVYKKTQRVEGCDSASYLFETSASPVLKTLYLKPCWVCFGPRKDRPEFQITIAITDLRTNKSQVLHHWNAEIHCHKMESSAKGKLMDNNFPPNSLIQSFFLPA